MDYEKHFLREDVPRLNLEVEVMHRSALNVIDSVLKGNMDEAQASANRMLDALDVARALNTKKLKRDENERHAMAVRSNYF